MITEVLTWTPVSEPPDDDTTVLLRDPASFEPVWLGYREAGGWRFVDGEPATPTHWSHIPKGPEA